MKIKLNHGAKQTELKAGLMTLNDLWKKGYLPDDIEKHFFLTWFALSEGIILRAVKQTGLHRNTFQNYLIIFGLRGKAIKMRFAWEKLDDGKGDKTISHRIHTFYKKYDSKIKLTPQQNDALVRLWKTGIPLKMTLPHFVLWATRAGKSREWMKQKLDFSNRHLIRVLTGITKNSSVMFWLAPLKPQIKEIYKPMYHSRLKKRGLI
jgi:hypothetical protein